MQAASLSPQDTLGLNVVLTWFPAVGTIWTPGTRNDQE